MMIILTQLGNTHTASYLGIYNAEAYGDVAAVDLVMNQLATYEPDIYHHRKDELQITLPDGSVGMLTDFYYNKLHPSR